MVFRRPFVVLNIFALVFPLLLLFISGSEKKQGFQITLNNVSLYYHLSGTSQKYKHLNKRNEYLRGFFEIFKK